MNRAPRPESPAGGLHHASHLGPQEAADMGGFTGCWLGRGTPAPAGCSHAGRLGPRIGPARRLLPGAPAAGPPPSWACSPSRPAPGARTGRGCPCGRRPGMCCWSAPRSPPPSWRSNSAGSTQPRRQPSRARPQDGIRVGRRDWRPAGICRKQVLCLGAALPPPRTVERLAATPRHPATARTTWPSVAQAGAAGPAGIAKPFRASSRTESPQHLCGSSHVSRWGK